MDADLQHDETLLSTMLETLQNDDIDIVIGSRYLRDDGVDDWSKSRTAMSQFATRLSRLVSHADLTDPMSGFFMFRREMRNLSGIGFKILLDLFASSPQPPRFRELPYNFRTRRAGASKLDAHAMWNYGMLLLEKMIGHLVPVRFVAFTLVGGLGVGVHFATLSLLYRALEVGFVPSHAMATAMTFNFAVNNV